MVDYYHIPSGEAENGSSEEPAFEQVLKAGPLPAATPSPSASLDLGEDRVNILIVDDRPDKRLAMETIITDLGQNIVKANSGRDALRCLLHQTFAVILLDVNMPGMDGFETALLIRQRKATEHTPIIFVTGISDTETHVSRGYSLGAVDYILTPVVPEVLRAKVSVFVQLFKSAEKIRRQAESLRRAHDELEIRIKERTAELAIANETLQTEILERQRAEEKILKLNSELEQRVLERTAALLEANQELETFTHSIAHDLRAPLRQIHSYAQILEDEAGDLLPPEPRQYLKRIGDRGKNMGQMVDDLLNLSHVSRQDLDRHDADLNTIVEEVVTGIRADAGNRHIKWEIHSLPHVECNAGLIKQAFSNLLLNSFKYTRPRAEALIEVGQMEIDEETVFYVRDNGVGFDMKHADKLFGVFQRLHRAEDFEGTGVGLAIVDRIVRKHGGRIWAEAVVDKGATFYFTLGNK